MRCSCVFLILTIIIGIGGIVYLEKVFEEEKSTMFLQDTRDDEEQVFLPQTEKTFIINDPSVEKTQIVEKEGDRKNDLVRGGIRKAEYFSLRNPQDTYCSTSKSFNAAGRSFNDPRAPFLKRSESLTRKCFVREKNKGLGILVGFY